MLPDFLFPEQAVTQDGQGPPVEIAVGAGLVEITLGITAIKEQQSLEAAIYGSADGETWTPKPVLAFPQKFYTGVAALMLDLSAHPGLRFLRVAYKMTRWGHWKDGPMFRFYLFAQPVSLPAAQLRDK